MTEIEILNQLQREAREQKKSEKKRDSSRGRRDSSKGKRDSSAARVSRRTKVRKKVKTADDESSENSYSAARPGPSASKSESVGRQATSKTVTTAFVGGDDVVPTQKGHLHQIRR